MFDNPRNDLENKQRKHQTKSTGRILSLSVWFNLGYLAAVVFYHSPMIATLSKYIKGRYHCAIHLRLACLETAHRRASKRVQEIHRQ